VFPEAISSLPALKLPEDIVGCVTGDEGIIAAMLLVGTPLFQLADKFQSALLVPVQVVPLNEVITVAFPFWTAPPSEKARYGLLNLSKAKDVILTASVENAVAPAQFVPLNAFTVALEPLASSTKATYGTPELSIARDVPVTEPAEAAPPTRIHALVLASYFFTVATEPFPASEYATYGILDGSRSIDRKLASAEEIGPVPNGVHVLPTNFATTAT
jgi:hypothetical protein